MATLGFVYSIGEKGTSIDSRYVGVTINAERREYEHFKSLREGVHDTTPLQEAFNENFDFRIELIGNIDYCYEVEASLRPKWRVGLNISPGGRGGVSEGRSYENNPWSKPNRKKRIGNEFTSETSRELALKRIKENRHNFNKEKSALGGKNALKSGNHIFIKEHPNKTLWLCTVTNEINTKAAFTYKARKRLNLNEWPHKLIKEEKSNG